MTELEQNLRSIKNEKDTKILPENIKEGVQIFDVIGTYRGTNLNVRSIYHTANFSQRDYFNISYYYENTITFYKNYTFICYTFASGLSQGTLRIYNRNVLEYSGSYSSYISTTNVTNGKIVILGENTVNNRIYFGMPYGGTEPSSYLSIGYYDTVEKTVTYVKRVSLPISIYYDNKSVLTSNNRFHQLYYDTNLIFYNRGTGGLNMATFDTNTETITVNTSKPLNSGCVYIAPNYFLAVNSKTLYKIINDIEHQTYEIQSITSTSYIDGVSFDGTKIFMNGNMYELSNNGTIGNVIYSNVYTRQSGFVIKAINDTYYFYNRGLYTINNEHKFELQLDNMSFNGNTLYKSDDTSIVNTFNFTPTENEIGIIFNDTVYLFPSVTSIPNTYILDGYIAYTYDGTQVQGTMSNNGQLNYTPTTSQQTIPAGYTSGGTIGAISVSEQEYQEDLDLANDILGID